jgi:hypothetical protein
MPVERDGARHSNHTNSTDCDDVTGTRCACLCAPSAVVSFNLCYVVREGVDGVPVARRTPPAPWLRALLLHW